MKSFENYENNNEKNINGTIIFTIAIIISLSALIYTIAGMTSKSTTVSSSLSASENMFPANDLKQAPELKNGDWINSEPLSLAELKGRVVLIDFWTFGCYNCRNTLPTLKKFDEHYRDKGLTIIGVHTPEFDSEKKIENVRSNVNKLGIKYPVLTDNEFETWNAYGVRAWPSVFILDKQGRIRYTHVGEGRYDEQEQVIKTLLNEKE